MRAGFGGLLVGALALLTACASAPTDGAGERETPGGAAEAVAPAPERRSGPVVLSTEPWSFDGAEGRVIRTRHYRVFTTERDALLTDRLPDFLERALAHYRTALAPLPAPPMRLDTYLMDNRTQWANVTRRLLGGRATPFLRIQRGGYATRGVGVYYDIGVFDTLAIAAHEGWHQFTQRALRERLPTWLEEGVATYMEGHKWAGSTPVFLAWANLERFDHLRQVEATGEMIPLRRLLTGSPQDGLGPGGDALTYYAQVWALTHFLSQPGERRLDGLRRILTDAKDGRLRRVLAASAARRAEATGDRIQSADDLSLLAFETYFGPVEEAQAAYEGFVSAIVAPGGRDRVVAGRSPVEQGG